MTLGLWEIVWPGLHAGVGTSGGVGAGVLLFGGLVASRGFFGPF